MAAEKPSDRRILWILTTPRSGSNYVTGEIWRRLGGTPRPMEFFNAESVAFRSDFTPDPSAPVRSYLDHLVARESLDGLLAVKILWGQLQHCCRYSDFLPQLSMGKIVMLRRRDVVRQGISHYLMRETGAWASGVAPRRLRPDQVAYDYDAIAEHVDRAESHNARLERFLRAWDLQHVTIVYEDFVKDPETESARVLAHVGLAPAAGPGPEAGLFERQSSAINEEFRERFLSDERARFGGDGSYRGPPLFPGAGAAEP